MSSAVSIEQYKSYRGLPPLAGLCNFTQAARPGLSVEECVARLKRFHYAHRRLHQILTARITSEPIMELKTAFSHHAYLCAEHVTMVRDRVAEMREPPLGLEKIPHPALEIVFDELLVAPGTAELVAGIYEVALPALEAGWRKYQQTTNVLADAPSRRIARFIRLELEDMLAFGRAAVGCVVDEAARTRMSEWLQQLRQGLAAASGLDGSSDEKVATPARRYSTQPYRFDPLPRRDERFLDLWNQAFNAEALLYDPEMPVQAKVLALLFKRLRELDVPEMMASIIAQTPGKPWDYYRDMARQLWDEARHAMMGEAGFVALGVDWTQCRITFNWSYRLNTECTPQERHAVLWFIEQGLMGKDGKRLEWEVGKSSEVDLMATFQDYDWADEVLHAQFGREWYVKPIGDRDRAKAYGDQAWSKILSNWQSLKDQGLTQHTNWWPRLYRQACEAMGLRPDPYAAAFAVDYNNARADLQDVAHALNSA